MFSVLGIPVYRADDESKKFLNDPATVHELTGLFGPGILAGEQIDRKALASVVFGNDAALNALTSILHPKVRQDFRIWLQIPTEAPYVIQEAAILFESGSYSEFDRVITVSCPRETAIDRVVKRDGVDGREVLRRMRHQMEDAEKCRRADFVIVNDGTRAVLPQVLAIHEQLLKVCPQRNDDVPPGSTDA